MNSNSHFGFFEKKIVKGRARRPAPTCLEFAIILNYFQHLVGATPCGRPIPWQNENCWKMKILFAFFCTY
jgi:hypothetical protein